MYEINQMNQKIKWNSSHITDQSEKIFLITGASSGLGKEASIVLANKNAKIIMAVRNVLKATTLKDEILKTNPKANIDIQFLDLTQLSSVKSFCESIILKYDRIDVLICNAGIMMCPFSKTSDGFEIQMGTNHLGHYALVGMLFPILKRTFNSRIVITSSLAHKQGKINFEDIHWDKRKYKTIRAYGDSKLANLYFAYELIRKIKDTHDAPMVTICHPGWTKTELDRHYKMAALIGNLVAQNVQMGTLPTLRAATDESAKTGDYYGPNGIFEMKGYPVLVDSNKLSKDVLKAQKLWELSENLTGVKYDFN